MPLAPDKCAFEEALGKCAEAFLAGRVPDLELQLLPVDHKKLETEVDGNGGQVVFEELVFGEALDDASLANASLADHQDLSHVVEVLFVGGVHI